MLDVLANIISSFVPGKPLRRKVRYILKFGLLKYYRTLREEAGREFKYCLAVCGIAKNEALYFKEWLDFHRLVGVEKFYIYDNESSDNTKEVLEPYIAAGIVEYIPWPGFKQQLPAYNDCLKNHADEARWIAFIDLDEFLVPAGTQSLADILNSLPPDAAQLIVDGVTYGSSGHEKRPEGLVIENYKHRMLEHAHHHHKSILKPRLFAKSGTHRNHSMIFGKTVDENGMEIDPFAKPLILTRNKIRLNHYHCKSWEDYAKRAARGGVATGFLGKYDRAQFEANNFNDVRDPIMDSYIEALKNQPGADVKG